MPLKLCWILYVSALSVWTLLNIMQLRHTTVGYWIYMGTAVSSLFMRYHFSRNAYELGKIRSYILLMTDTCYDTQI